jgi:hypothetical protein
VTEKLLKDRGALLAFKLGGGNNGSGHRHPFAPQIGL